MRRFRISLRIAWLGIGLLMLAGCQPGFFSRKDAEPPYAKNPCIVLALPASGPYSQLAGRIKAGAELARKELAQRGTQVRLENINTESPDWITRLASLPEACAVVGGPLQDKAYLAARNAGLLEQRVFFAFMPSLEKGQEGVRAWRFFPGPGDQVEALTNFATDQQKIRTYGVFYPADTYGRRMSELMEQSLSKRNIPLQKASYNPRAPQSWAAALKPLISPRFSEDGHTIVPQTVFEALFVPDSWKNMDMITKALSVNGEDRLVLLGTTLWEQGLAGKQVPEATRYSLAVFPGAWMQASAPAALRSRDNNFWNALGYDFINFGAAVALDMRPDARFVTSRAQKSAPSVRGLAPMSWDNGGLAHQRMYLFQITPSGMAPLDEKRFQQARTAISERAALRMQGWNTIDPAGLPKPVTSQPVSPEPETPSEPVEPAVVKQVSAPVATPAVETPEPVTSRPAPTPVTGNPLSTPAPLPPNEGVMSTTPHPSHKLSLPVRN